MLKKLFVKENKAHKKQAKRDRHGFKVEPEDLDGFVVVTKTDSNEACQPLDAPPTFDTLGQQNTMGAHQSNESAKTSARLHRSDHLSTTEVPHTGRHFSDVTSTEFPLSENDVPVQEQQYQRSSSLETMHDDIEFTLSPQLCAMLDTGNMIRDRFTLPTLSEYDGTKYEYDFSLEKSVLRNTNL